MLHIMRKVTVVAKFNLPFPRRIVLHVKKVKTSNIYDTIPLICFNLSQCVWENNGLLNKNYWNDLDSINQGHSKGII